MKKMSISISLSIKAKNKKLSQTKHKCINSYMSHKIFPFCSILSVLYSFSPNYHMYVVTSKIIKVILTMLQAKKQHYIWSIHIFLTINIYIYIYIINQLFNL